MVPFQVAASQIDPHLRVFKTATIMQFLQLFGALALAATAYGQSFEIAVPASGQALTAGEAFTVEIDQPVSCNAQLLFFLFNVCNNIPSLSRIL